MTDFSVDGLDHVELNVVDQRAAAAWYERVLGLRVLDAYEHWVDDGPLMVSSDDGRTKLALFEGDPEPTGEYRVAFAVDAVGFVQFLARVDDLSLSTADGEPVTANDYVDHGGALSLYFADPDGHPLEVTTYETPSVGPDD